MATLLQDPERMFLSVFSARSFPALLHRRFFILVVNQLLLATRTYYDILLHRRTCEATPGLCWWDMLRLSRGCERIGLVIHLRHGLGNVDCHPASAMKVEVVVHEKVVSRVHHNAHASRCWKMPLWVGTDSPIAPWLTSIGGLRCRDESCRNNDSLWKIRPGTWLHIGDYQVWHIILRQVYKLAEANCIASTQVWRSM